MQKAVPRDGTTGVQSVDRALDILSCVASSDRPSLTHISQRLGLSKSTVHRLLSCLQARRVVEKDVGGRYRVGVQVFQWSGSSTQQGALVSLVLPFLQELRDETNETVSFHILVGRHHVCIEQAVSRHELRRAVEMGSAVPLGLGATGKAILAHLPEDERKAALALWDGQGLRHIDPQALEKELIEVRARGVAVSSGERLQGTVAASAPVFNYSGRAMGAMSLSGPAQRLPAPVLETHARRLKDFAARLSRELRYLPGDMEY